MNRNKLNNVTFSTVIFPRYSTGPSLDNSENSNSNNEQTSDITISRQEMARVVLGEHFTLSCGKEVNKTYKTWVKNLAVLQCSGYISEYLAQGFLLLNQYRRSETEGTKQDDVPDFYYPPYII